MITYLLSDIVYVYDFALECLVFYICLFFVYIDLYKG